MKNISINAVVPRTGSLSLPLDPNHKQLQTLKNEICELKKVNNGLEKRLGILRGWALKNIHWRNEMMQNAASK